MEYRNKKTGAVINVESELRGDWEPVIMPAPVSDVKAGEAPAQKKRARKTK